MEIGEQATRQAREPSCIIRQCQSFQGDTLTIRLQHYYETPCGYSDWQDPHSPSKTHAPSWSIVWPWIQLCFQQNDGLWAPSLWIPFLLALERWQDSRPVTEPPGVLSNQIFALTFSQCNSRKELAMNRARWATRNTYLVREINICEWKHDDYNGPCSLSHDNYRAQKIEVDG